MLCHVFHASSNGHTGGSWNGATPKLMVYNGKPQSKIDDLEVPPLQETFRQKHEMYRDVSWMLDTIKKLWWCLETSAASSKRSRWLLVPSKRATCWAGSLGRNRYLLNSQALATQIHTANKSDTCWETANKKWTKESKDAPHQGLLVLSWARMRRLTGKWAQVLTRHVVIDIGQAASCLPLLHEAHLAPSSHEATWESRVRDPWSVMSAVAMVLCFQSDGGFFCHACNQQNTAPL